MNILLGLLASISGNIKSNISMLILTIKILPLENGIPKSISASSAKSIRDIGIA